jgi:hypothetical protein
MPISQQTQDHGCYQTESSELYPRRILCLGRNPARKTRIYRNNPVLQDYRLVSSTSIEMDLYHKNDAGEWMIINYQLGDLIELKSINLSFAIEQIYRNLNLTPEPLK